MRLRVGIDVGGTFTDVTAFDEDQSELVAVRKYTSNPAAPAAVMEEITQDLARDNIDERQSGRKALQNFGRFLGLSHAGATLTTPAQRITTFRENGSSNVQEAPS